MGKEESISGFFRQSRAMLVGRQYQVGKGSLNVMLKFIIIIIIIIF